MNHSQQPWPAAPNDRNPPYNAPGYWPNPEVYDNNNIGYSTYPRPPTQQGTHGAIPLNAQFMQYPYLYEHVTPVNQNESTSGSAMGPQHLVAPVEGIGQTHQMNRTRPTTHSPRNGSLEPNRQDPRARVPPKRWPYDEAIKIEDIRTLTRWERSALLRGKLVPILRGPDIIIAEIPYPLLLATSKVSKGFYLKSGNISNISLPGHLDADAIGSVVYWLKNICTKTVCYALPPTNDLRFDLARINVGDELCLGDLHRSLINHWWKRIKREGNTFPRYEWISAIDAAAREPKDRFLHCIANRLAHCELYNRIPDMDEYKAYMKRHDKMADAVQARLAPLLQRREDEEAERRRKEDEEKEALRHNRGKKRAAEREANAAVARKVDGAKISTVTAEEAERLWTRRRG